MSYHNVVHVGHQRDPQPGYPSEYPPPPDFLPSQQPGFPNPYYDFPGPPPPPQPPHQRYQDYFHDGYPPSHSASQPFSRNHDPNPYVYDYDNGCSPFLNTCLGALCCCWVCQRCCLGW